MMPELIDDWLDFNTFYCPKLRLRCTREFCEKLKGRPKADLGNKYDQVILRPPQCDKCDGPEPLR